DHISSLAQRGGGGWVRTLIFRRWRSLQGMSVSLPTHVTTRRWGRKNKRLTLHIICITPHSLISLPDCPIHAFNLADDQVLTPIQPLSGFPIESFVAPTSHDSDIV